MGNYKFRFSDMIPNAWFHKLKDMSQSKPRSNHPKTTLNSSKNNNKQLSYSFSLPPPPHATTCNHTTDHSDQRKSYYFTRDQPHSSSPPPINPAPEHPPRKSSRIKRRSTTTRNRRQPRLVSSSISAGCSCRASVEWAKPAPDEDSRTNSGRDCSTGPDQSSSSLSEPDSVLTEYGSDRGDSRSMVSWPSPSKCKLCKCGGATNDIILDIDSSRNLAPILTKRRSEPTKVHQRTSAEFSETNAYGSLSVKVVKEDFVKRRLPAKNSSSSPGMRLRVNSPRIANRRMVQQGRRSVSRRSNISESLAVVKASKDPRRDFRESMVEMIMENNIRSSGDLEELLACYLSLNSDEYHDLIINVFKQIWFDFIHLRLN